MSPILKSLRMSLVVCFLLGIVSSSPAQTILESDFETTFPGFGYSYDYAGEGDSTCAGLPVSDDEVSSTYDVMSSPAATATFDTSNWVYPPDACYTYAGWGFGIGYSLPSNIRLDSGTLSDYTMSFDATVSGVFPGADAQLYVIMQSPDSNGDGNPEELRIGVSPDVPATYPLPYFDFDIPQSFTVNLGDLGLVNDQYDFATNFAQTTEIILQVQPYGDANSIGLDDDNVLTIDNIVFQGPSVALPNGDFDDNGLFECADVDSLVAEIAAGTNDAAFDMTGDGLVNTDDLNSWLAAGGAANLPSGAPYLSGDATLDGSVDVSDFNNWNANKFTNNVGWCGGDFTADGSVDVSDFNEWNANKFQSSGGPVAVPEPANLCIFAALGLLGCLIKRK